MEETQLSTETTQPIVPPTERSQLEVPAKVLILSGEMGKATMRPQLPSPLR